ncbi:hypothetical protein NDU88_009935 [Pleurodeles waltl]|uniref:Uncharacterized protein n=1 Tax=Pleurodeles waltl TaxID=8319 RepID=A0AAV7S1U1_PLEWA|nr:hypothetical protein NDU88_009935 [Pleurodeles waltl]
MDEVKLMDVKYDKVEIEKNYSWEITPRASYSARRYILATRVQRSPHDTALQNKLFAHIKLKKKITTKGIAASAYRGRRTQSTGPHLPARPSKRDTQACLCGVAAILLRRVQPTRGGRALQSEDSAPDGGDAPLQASEKKQRSASGETPEAEFNFRALPVQICSPDHRTHAP